MRGFFGAFFVFLIWTSACIYYVSINRTATPTTDTPTELSVDNESVEDNSLTNKTLIPSTTSATSDIDLKVKTADSIARTFVARETSLSIAEEIQNSISISDTIDFSKDEPALDFNDEIITPTGPSFSSNIFYPQYNNTDLILDKKLVSYASELKQLLKDHPDKKVTIIGHTDNVGNGRDNFSQGLKKSRQVKWYLTTRRGIPRRKITATSRGEEEPIDTNKSTRGRKKNNRIEIIVD